MVDHTTTMSGGTLGWLSGDDQRTTEVWALVIAWSLEEPGRVGEIVPLPSTGPRHILGRGAAAEAGDDKRALVFRQRPAELRSTGPLTSRRISRRQLALMPAGAQLGIERLGRCVVRVNGAEVDRADCRAGDVIELDKQLVFYVTRRPAAVARSRSWPERATFAFGAPDPHGLVGESPGSWALRDELAFAAARSEHVLVLGASGVGKELAARSLHGLSQRRSRPLVSRNAATFPEGLIDAELFGNIKDYPNPGMRERAGLVGEASGSTLFLDEIGELPTSLQSHLLRVLDSDGEYQRLGEPRPRRSDLRLVAATNRDPDELKHDLLARFKLRVAVPGLDARREDIPLIARQLLRAIAAEDPALGERFFDGWNGRTGEPRIAPDLMTALLRVEYTHHVRQLEALLWRAMSASDGNFLGLTPELQRELRRAVLAEHRDPTELGRDEIEACLVRHDWNQSRAYRELGLSSRHALYRLIKKHGLAVPKDATSPGDP